MAGDIFVNLTDIRADIDHNAPEEEFLKWHDYCMTLHALSSDNFSISTPNYDHWLRGCPRKSEEEIHRLEELHANVMQAKVILEDAIKRDGFENGK